MAFRRIITNFLTNAIRYGNSGLITIILSCDDEKTTVQIKDNGPGVPEEFTDKVFQPFYRLEKSRNTQTGGSGLGLAIVQQLADKYGWQVSLKPRKNNGTNAILTINN